VKNSFEPMGVKILRSVDDDLLCNAGVFHREAIKTWFKHWKEDVKNDKFDTDPELAAVSQAEQVAKEKEELQLEQEFENQFYKWYDGDSPLGKLEAYFDVFTITKASRRAIKSLATKYMRFANFMPEFTEEEAIRFLRATETKSNSRKTYSLYLRTFFKAQGIPKDKLPFEYNRIRIADVDRPQRKTFPYEKVKQFIYSCKESENGRACFYGALSTIYGFRPIEMSRLTPENIDQDKHQISVQTAKHGRMRIHHIPEAIRPYVYNYEPKQISDKSMPKQWGNICRDIGFRPPHGYSWYGMRHSLFTNLVNKSGLPAMVLDKWGGWQSGQVSGAGMVYIYHAPDAQDMADIDKMVLDNHPFLGFWDGK